jgi:single-stranded-DNA-specific exonuclease
MGLVTEKSCRIRGVEVLAVDDAVVELVERASGLSTIVARVLAARGVNSQDAVERFLSPSLERDWLDPLGIPGMGEAAQQVAAAIEGRERICVFGDFDLDGISSSALAARGLAELGADVVPLVPHRFDEGYGLSAPAIERMMRTISPRLVVTVDTGISSREEIAALNTAGVDVVVTDHHEPGDLTPLSIPMTNPKLDPACPSQSLSGAGVALKLVHAVGLELGRPDVWRSLTDLAALGTIADIVPLVGENRALVADGIRRLNADPRVSLAALANVAGLAPGSIDGEGVAYGLSPRLNAAGRMADPAVALELLMTDDEETARTLATALDEYNRLRQSVEADLTAAALEQAKGELAKGRPGLVLAGEGWHEGVKGIVASRLASMYGLPTMLFSVENGEARGSGRSVGTVDLFQTTSACADLLTRFGGHAAAVGLTLPAADLPLFAERFCDILGTLPEERFVSSKAVDALLPLSAVSVELGVELERLAPFGHSNPRPRFVVPGVFMTSRQRVGRANDHLRFTAYDGSVSIPAIAFKCKDIERLSEHDAAVDLVASLEVDEWRGRRRAQLLVSGLHELESPEDAPAAALVEDLFARADAILAREEYAGIEDATSFHTKLAGVTFEGRQEVLARLKAGTPLRIERQPDNVHDASACALFSPDGAQVGFFNRRLAAAFAPVLDAGVEYDVTVTDVTGGDTRDRAWGVNVLVERRGDADVTARAGMRQQVGDVDTEDAIHPGQVSDTPAWMNQPKEVLDNLKSRTALGRLVTTEDVIHATVFLFENRGVTGVNLRVDGGRMMK